jgi:mannose-6-phosphate isomerase
MGTHPSNPSKDVSTGRTLASLFEDNQALLSSTINAKYGPKLPFLFKVLSIHKALSIQAHPNKQLAEKLHARDPKNYPDDNHKPEMAIAITDFEGLCGFRPLEEISHFLSTVQALKTLVGDETADEFIQTIKEAGDSPSDETIARNKKALQKIFSALMTSDPSAIQVETDKLVSAAQDEGDNFAGGGVVSTDGAKLAELVVRLHGEFGADIGLFVLFFLNFVTLAPGEALFLRADDVHAYLSGDIIECMAASDNVVRAGLTPKFKDVGTLVDMLTYSYAPIEEQKMEPTDLYDPPIEEFAVVRSVLRGNRAKATFEPLDGPSVVICTAGKGRISVGPTSYKVVEGNVFFLGATAELAVESEGGADDEFITFKAFCEVETPTAGEGQ